METIRIEAVGGSKVYFTEADGFSQRRYLVSGNELLTKLKLSLLLTDHVIFAANHVLESDATFNLLRNNLALLEGGAILLDLRDECRDFLDFVELEQHHGDQPAFYRQEAGRLKQRAIFLNEQIPRAIHWTAEPVAAAFRDSLVRDLLNPQSPLRRKLIAVDRNSLARLTWEVGNNSFLTREKISALSVEYLGKKKGVLQKYADMLYYLAGAAHLQAEPVVHPELVNWYRAKFSGISHALRPRIGEREAFMSLLDRFSVSASVLDRLSNDQLLVIRNDKLSKSFRKKWHDIVVQTKETGEYEYETETAHGLLAHMVEQVAAVEKKEERRFKQTRKVLLITSVVTSIFSVFIADPALGLASLLAELSTIDPLLGYVERKWGGMEIMLFCSKLQKSSQPS